MTHLNYCLINYYPCLDYLSKYRLQKIQNNCIRFIFKLRKFDHVSHKIAELKWLKIEKMFNYHLAVFAFKLFFTSQPSYLRIKFRFRRSMHDANLRFTNHLSMPLFHSEMFKRSLTYQVIKIFNSCNLFVTCISVNNFRKKYKEMLSQ